MSSKYLDPLFSRNQSLSPIKPHLFSEDSNKSTQVIGYSAIVAQNSQQMTIVQKYKKFGENATAHEELCILLENFEQIQVSLGTYQKDFIQERDSTYESVQKEVAEINEKFSNLFKQYSFQPPLGLFDTKVFAESKILKEFWESSEEAQSAISKLSEWTGNQSGELLYRASRDGWDSKHFHQKCDEQGKSIVICKDTNGNIFGGYTEQSWNSSSNKYQTDPNAFLFSLKSPILQQPEKFKVKDPSNAIYCDSEHGPVFGGGHDLFIYSNANQNTSSYHNLGTSYENATGNAHCLTGSQTFQLSEYEVFRMK